MQLIFLNRYHPCFFGVSFLKKEQKPCLSCIRTGCANTTLLKWPFLRLVANLMPMKAWKTHEGKTMGNPWKWWSLWSRAPKLSDKELELLGQPGWRLSLGAFLPLKMRVSNRNLLFPRVYFQGDMVVSGRAPCTRSQVSTTWVSTTAPGYPYYPEVVFRHDLNQPFCRNPKNGKLTWTWKNRHLHSTKKTTATPKTIFPKEKRYGRFGDLILFQRKLFEPRSQDALKPFSWSRSVLKRIKHTCWK